MRKLIFSMHVSLDGYVGGPNGEMDWIKLDNELFEFVNKFTSKADAALYARKTWEMMEGYWPNAGDQPNASKHDRDHSTWYKKITKYVLSDTLKDQKVPGTVFLSGNIGEQVRALKEKEGKDIIIFGSPSAGHLLTNHQLIDEYWLFVNPIILGGGIPMFPKQKDRVSLKLGITQTFPCGVIGLQYARV